MTDTDPTPGADGNVAPESPTGTDGQKEEQKDVPFHEHPRWKEMMETNSTLLNQNKEMTDLIESRLPLKEEPKPEQNFDSYADLIAAGTKHTLDALDKRDTDKLAAQQTQDAELKSTLDKLGVKDQGDYLKFLGDDMIPTQKTLELYQSAKVMDTKENQKKATEKLNNVPDGSTTGQDINHESKTPLGEIRSKGMDELIADGLAGN